MGKKTYRVVMSERCYRFKPDAIPGHAPAAPGVYEFVTFDEQRQPKVLYVGLAPESVQQALMEHLLGRRKPAAAELFDAHKDVYFDYVSRSSETSPQDLADIAAALAVRHRPSMNPELPPFTGRFDPVEVVEVEVL